jgi:hypothetical protein
VAAIDIGSGERQILMSGVRAIYVKTGHLVVLRPDGVLVAARFDR